MDTLEEELEAVLEEAGLGTVEEELEGETGLDTLEEELEAVLEEAFRSETDGVDSQRSAGDGTEASSRPQADDAPELDVPTRTAANCPDTTAVDQSTVDPSTTGMATEHLPASTAVDQPTAATAVDLSTAGTAVHQSTAATAVDQPTTATAVDQSTIGSAVDQSTAARAVGQPTAATAVDQSTTGTAVDQSTAATAVGQPTAATALDQSGTTTAMDQERSTELDVDDLELEREEMARGRFDARSSRYMIDEKGELLKKWKVDYAARGGQGRATCKDALCLERQEQGGVKTIEKGALRIGRRVLMDAENGGGHVAIMWHHARCIFNTFLRARKDTRTITSEADLDGFENILPEDQEILRRLMDGSEGLKNARFRSFDGGAASSTKTPQKRDGAAAAAPGGFDPYGGYQSAAKRRRQELEERELKKGDRVWAHFRCRAPDRGDGALGAAIAIKSPKPELAMVREEVVDDMVIVQFEKAEDEKERVEKFNTPKFRRLRGWLRYPRVFEGKKQKVPLKWIDMKRAPPKLCGCVRQEWGHSCDCGISCGRGVQNKVFGVADGY